MSFLNVQNIGTDRNVKLVVDSRLIAEILGVSHGDWVRNIIYKYQAEIEEDFGQLRFENGYVNIPNGGKKETIYVLLDRKSTRLNSSHSSPSRMPSSA